MTGSKNQLCVILFFEAWVLDSQLKFFFGCIGVILLGKLHLKGMLRNLVVEGIKEYEKKNSTYLKCINNLVFSSKQLDAKCLVRSENLLYQFVISIWMVFLNTH